MDSDLPQVDHEIRHEHTAEMDDGIAVIAPNLKRRLSGVTATVARLVPLQARGICIVATGPGLPADVPHIGLYRVLMLPRATPRVWHARRNTEMLLGLILRHGLRKNLRLVFTSASQREHSRYTRWLIARMDAVAVPSRRSQAYLRVPSSVIPHGVDTARFRPATDPRGVRAELGLPDGMLVGCFGRIRPSKGTDLFVDAMLDVMAGNPAVSGVVLGRATRRDRRFETVLRERVAAAGMDARLVFLPEVPVDAISRWYQALDLFVAPQRWEGFGLTPLEAMACGVPVVATRVGAFEDQVDEGETGLLVPPGDVRALAAAIGSAVEAIESGAAWGGAARELVRRRFDIAGEAEALTDLYRGLLAARPHASITCAGRLPVSAFVICKDEAEVIGNCLLSLGECAEIVVVDSGSTDGTRAIVEAFIEQGWPIRLVRQDWLGYGAQKQLALERLHRALVPQP